jgi:hypothetical protein
MVVRLLEIATTQHGEMIISDVPGLLSINKRVTDELSTALLA